MRKKCKVWLFLCNGVKPLFFCGFHLFEAVFFYSFLMILLMTREELVAEGVKWQSALVGFAHGIIRDWNLAEDAVQKAYLTAYQKADSFDDRTPVYAWLRGIVRLKCFEIIREEDKLKNLNIDEELSQLIDEKASERWDEDYVQAKKTQEEALNHCLKKLKPKSLDLLMDYYRDAISGEALAKKLGRTLNAFYVSLSRTRQSVRNCCDQFLKEKGHDS